VREKKILVGPSKKTFLHKYGRKGWGTLIFYCKVQNILAFIGQYLFYYYLLIVACFLFFLFHRFILCVRHTRHMDYYPHLAKFCFHWKCIHVYMYIHLENVCNMHYFYSRVFMSINKYRSFFPSTFYFTFFYTKQPKQSSHFSLSFFSHTIFHLSFFSLHFHSSTKHTLNSKLFSILAIAYLLSFLSVNNHWFLWLVVAKPNILPILRKRKWCQ